VTAPGLRPICDYGRCQQILAGFAHVRDKLVADQARTASGWLVAAIDRAGLDDAMRERLMDALRQVLAETAGEREHAA
jgi:hypothetical protein